MTWNEKTPPVVETGGVQESGEHQPRLTIIARRDASVKPFRRAWVAPSWTVAREMARELADHLGGEAGEGWPIALIGAALAFATCGIVAWALAAVAP